MKKPSLISIFIAGMLCVSPIISGTIERPKIGLVLSGGGARGFAHIGILKMIDSLQIPIDFIVGTSMGGIGGALYAIGYTGEELQDMAFQNNWMEILSDKPGRSLKPYFQKIEDGKYQVELGLLGLVPTIPSGLIVGQRLSLLFSSLTFAYESVHDFDHLPIPFRCVAVDLNTGNEVVIKKGSLAQAMRATMAIPTIFSALTWGDSLLVDGGIVNNLPVDVVKKMGADLVIAVDVGDSPTEQRQINNIIDVFQQTLSIVGLEKWRENITLADILIQPDLTGFSIADFENDKIKSIIQRGDQAARENLDALEALKDDYMRMSSIATVGSAASDGRPRIEEIRVTGLMSTSEEKIRSNLHVHEGDPLDVTAIEDCLNSMMIEGICKDAQYEVRPLSDETVRLNVRIRRPRAPQIFRISVDGYRNLPFWFVYRMLGVNPGDRLNLEYLNSHIMRMYGLGYFRSIRYAFEPAGEGRLHMKVQVEERPKRQISLGLRYDDFHNLIIAAGLQTTNFPLAGMCFKHEFQFAGLWHFRSKAFYPSRTMNLPVYPLLQFEYKSIPTDIFSTEGRRAARYDDRSFAVGVGVGFLISHMFNAEILYQYEKMDAKPSIAVPDSSLSLRWVDQLRYFKATMDIDGLDDILLPRNGFLIRGLFEGSYLKLESDIPYTRMSLSTDFYKTFFQRHTLRMYGFYGTGSSKLPVYKYLNQGRPHTFVGMQYDQLSGSQLSLLRLDYRYEFKDNLFVTFMGNMAFDFEYRFLGELYKAYNLKGFGVGLTLYTPLGVFDAIYGRGDKNILTDGGMQDVFYISVGTKF